MLFRKKHKKHSASPLPVQACNIPPDMDLPHEQHNHAEIGPKTCDKSVEIRQPELHYNLICGDPRKVHINYCLLKNSFRRSITGLEWTVPTIATNRIVVIFMSGVFC